MRAFRNLCLTAAAVVWVSSLAVTAQAETLYASRLTKLLDSAGGQAIGDVSPAAPLTVRGRSGGFVQVDIGGWSPAGGDRYLFRDVGMRISEIILTEDGLKARAGGETTEDDYGSEWQKATASGWIAEADTAPSLDPVWQAAADIYFSRCTRCHSLRRPGDFTANQWPQALKVMTVRAGLSPGDAALVTVLLQSHAKDQKAEDSFTQQADSKSAQTATPAPAAPPSPEEIAKGGELYKSANCFACHGDDAKTPVLPEYPRLAGQSQAYVLKQLGDFRSGVRGNDNAVMKDTLTPLAAGDLAALAAWLATR